MKPPTLRNYWHPIAIAEDISEQPQRFELLNEPLVAFRVSDQVTVLTDRCPHRGTALSLGWIEDGLITCPYHGWQYDHTGRCANIPSLASGSKIPVNARATTHLAKEASGVLWVALEEPFSSIPPFPQDRFGSNELRTVIVYNSIWETSAGRILENFLDLSHFPWVHEGYLGSRDNPITPEYEITKSQERITYRVKVPQPSAHDYYAYTLHLPFTAHIQGVNDNEITSEYISIAASPISKTTTRVLVWRSSQLSSDVNPEAAEKFQRDLLDQDKQIVESQRPVILPLEVRDEVHLKTPDGVAIAYRALLRTIDHDLSYIN